MQNVTSPTRPKRASPGAAESCLQALPIRLRPLERAFVDRRAAALGLPRSDYFRHLLDLDRSAEGAPEKFFDDLRASLDLARNRHLRRVRRAAAAPASAVPPDPFLADVARVHAKLGNNVNQIAKALNEARFRGFGESDMAAVSDLLKSLLATSSEFVDAVKRGRK